jgi:septal ring-binding cell division protein DamX
MVELEAARVRVETDKLVAEAVAKGQRTAEETRAETIQKAAAIEKKTALLEAQATVLLGEAKAGAKKLVQEASAEKFALAVDAFGSGAAYNQWVFANGLPDNIELNLLYAGAGTFWTDLKGFSETMLGRQAQQPPQNAPQPPSK